jgi:hypothetical protein
MVFLLPNNPISAKFLSLEEKKAIVQRMRMNNSGIENKQFKPYQVVEALVDPKTWILFPICFCLHNVNGAISGFGAIIVRSFGFSHLDSVLLTGAVGGCVIVCLVSAGVIAAYVPNVRCFLITVFEIPVIVGSCLIWKSDWTTQRGSAIGGFVILGSFAAGYMMLLSLVSSNIAGYTKKSITGALMWAAWGISNGVTPLWVINQEAPKHYPTVFKGVISTAAVAAVGALVLYCYLRWENRRRNKEHGKPNQAEVAMLALSDKTDRENPTFRYVL